LFELDLKGIFGLTRMDQESGLKIRLGGKLRVIEQVLYSYLIFGDGRKIILH
jgi:hypothetical protein